MPSPSDHPKAAPFTSVGQSRLELADALDQYSHWPAPTVIMADGPYGLGLFPGEPTRAEALPDWYEPHVAAWAEHALPETTLWFWCNEVGWANVHPVLLRHGWVYRTLNIWDKGVGHIAGNVNGKTIRRFPVVTEVCAQYVRDVRLTTGDGHVLPIQQWLRHEWQRSGLTLTRTNEACGVVNAATRKYFTACHLWYFPPPEMMELVVAYANQHGRATDWPYFSLDGATMLSAEQWSHMRAKWNHTHGITNVWQEPALRGTERVKDGLASLHANQKPLRLINRIISASSDEGDVVWEPFGGMATTAVACIQNGRQCFSAEIYPDYYKLAAERLRDSEKQDGQLQLLEE